ncbi:MAG TPA: surface lipoprotein assembly modifier, partial [Candidatus Binatia bacterium]
TALTLTRLGATAEAKAEVDLAIRAQPASPLTAPAQRLGEILTGAQREEKRFSGQLRTGVYYDSNIPVVPLPSGRLTDPDTFAFRQKNRFQDSWGTLAVVDLEYKWLKTAAWEGSVSHHFLQTYNYNPHLRDFNTQENFPTLSIVNNGVLPAFFGSMAYSGGAQLAYDYISLGNTPFIQRGIFSPYITLIENSWNATTLLFRFQGKDFFHNERAPGVDNQDALNNTVGWLHFFLFEKSRHYIKIGYQYDDENARGRNWDYRGHRLLAGFQYTLPWDVRFRYDLDYHWRYYVHRNTLHPESTPPLVRRRDNEPIHLVGVAKDFRFVVPFTAAVEYFYDRGHSNIDLYDFRRHNVTMSLAWHF